MEKNLKTTEFINRAISKHNNRYTYDKVEHVSPKLKVLITCRKHGDFEQLPHNHLSGQGCPKCANNQKSSKEEFIVKADLIHNKIYNYDKVVYVNCDTNVKIDCKIHGYFYQIPYSHLRGHKCKKCVGKDKTTSIFIDEANLVNGFKYSYNKSVYVKHINKLIITCPIHGDFEQTPSNHLRGHGCTKCRKRKTTNHEYVRKVNLVHNFKYNYDKLNYVNGSTKIKITCPLHGDFEQLPFNHLKGCGCSKCKLSKGEKQIFKVLNNLNVQFKTQYKFDDCVYKRKLLFDFAIFIDEKVSLIEFQGEQHFKEIPYFKSFENYKFNEIKIRDEIKQKYAKNILTINFNQTDKIEELITDFIERSNIPIKAKI